MSMVPLKLLTIIAERVLLDRLLRELRALGAKGYTISEVVGEGSRGVRASEWEGRNVKIELILSPEVAERALAHLSELYLPHFAVVAYVSSVEVMRGEKYV